MPLKQKRGYLNIGGRYERDTLTCLHCQFVIEVQPDKGADSPRMRLDRCGQCHATICRKCAAELARSMKCAPFEKRLEMTESRAALRKASGV